MAVFMVVDTGKHVGYFFARRHLKLRYSPQGYYAWHILPPFAAVVRTRRCRDSPPPTARLFTRKLHPMAINPRSGRAKDL
jgi:hypothetical protein